MVGVRSVHRVKRSKQKKRAGHGQQLTAAPTLAMAAHCASASDAASTTGTPMSLSSFLHSSLCSLVTCTAGVWCAEQREGGEGWAIP